MVDKQTHTHPYPFLLFQSTILSFVNKGTSDFGVFSHLKHMVWEMRFVTKNPGELVALDVIILFLR